ncbi:MAG: hypothetical protein ACOX9C_05510 [Kiritimatiellia bacterium]|jgi:hypothetical protein
MRGLDLLFFLIVIGSVIASVVKESKKVDRNRPADGDFGDGDGAKSIGEFLDELRRQAQDALGEPATNADSPEARQQAELREKVREAARRRREVAKHAAPPPLPAKAKAAAAPAAAVHELPASGRPAAPKVVTPVRKTGLAHPIFSAAATSPADAARRAVVLREILGPPVALQDRRHRV